MPSWKSLPLHVTSIVLGWIAFLSWSISFYPQIVLNHRRKSVVGYNFDYALLNYTKQIFYLIYNASVFFSPIVKKQYHAKHGQEEIVPVAVNDVAFSIHAVMTTSYIAFQILIYDRGNQVVSKTCTVLISAAFLAAMICTFIAIPRHSWFWLVSCFNTMQASMTVITYIPQVVFNFKRKSTKGFSIGNTLLDLLGGVSNLFQMILQSIDQRSLKNLFGNMGKFLLALATILFDSIIIVQHYILYPAKKAALHQNSMANSEQPSDIEAR